MRLAPLVRVTAAVFPLVWLGTATTCRAETLIDADFSRGSFAALDWKDAGDWDVFTYPNQPAKNPGPVARFAANKPDGSLTKSFPEVSNPAKLSLSLDYGWGWGEAGQAADMVSFRLLDPAGNGYVFEIHRTRAKWAVQWGRVAKGQPSDEKHWAAEEIDATHAAVRDGGGLSRLTVTRDADGSWTIADKDWNRGAGARVTFTDSTTTSFSQLVLVGNRNFDEQVFNRIVLTTGADADADAARDPAGSTARPVADFLDSIGVVTTFPDRGQPLPRTVEMIKYAGFRWVRGGIEGLKDQGPTTLQTYLDLHQQTGVRFSWGLGSGGHDIERLIETAKPLAAADALIAFEGNNEPNNWGVTYQGERGGGRAASWMPVAKLQRDLYAAVKRDPALRKYPVWAASEVGAEVDNVGLQFLTIPEGAGALLPAGTRFADAANVHNYIYHPGSADPHDNKAWNAADPTSACKVDGLYVNHGVTWARHFHGYPDADLPTLPRVTTETGTTIGGPVTEDLHALNLLSMYLDQFKRGWSHTAVYLLRDRADEGGNQAFGFFRPDYAPRKAAVYLHNLTSILSDRSDKSNQGSPPRKLGQLNYSISPQPATVHDLLLQKGDGTFELLIWGERLKGADEITVRLGDTFPSVQIYDTTLGADPIQTLHGVDSLKPTLRDHPLIIGIPQKPTTRPAAEGRR